jgi:hypothetical protein
VLPAHRIVLILLSCLVLSTGHARLGETLAKIKERYGKPAAQTRKDAAVWFFDTEDERQLVYTVTFNANGRSIAEGLKPLKRAVLTQDAAQRFIDGQIEPYRESKTMRTVRPGENYVFARQQFTGAEQEIVIVDDPNGILIVWTRGGLPSVMAVSPEMFK